MGSDAPGATELREAVELVRQDIGLLLQSAEGCATNHYAGDAEQFGLPGWLVDTRTRVEASLNTILAALRPHEGDASATRMAHMLQGKLSRGEIIDAEAIDRVLELVIAPRPEATDADREWALQMARGLPAASHGGEVTREAVALVSLQDCPPGLFLYNGTLGLKTEYGAMEIVGPADIPGDQVRWKVGNRPEAYVAASGEAFWGGKQIAEERATLMVEPVNADAVLALIQGDRP